ncbi:DUF4192 domain-containing protein [Nocardia sp. NPDC050435]|uniref:DUF4192 domain-containing protein n=1 Tax=Nocardia sp. NPDC050435 TaxID=3155040 RepID=UPI0033C83AA2
MPAAVPSPDPVAVITALPETLGFIPHRSLVFAVIAADAASGAPGLAGAARFDIDIAIHGRLAGREIAVTLERLSTRAHVAGVVAVIVDDRVSATYGRARDQRRQRRMLDRLRREMAATPVAVLGWWAVTEITEGAPYRDLDDPRRHGRLPARTAARPSSSENSLEPDPALHRRVLAAMPGAIAADRRLRAGTVEPSGRMLTALVLRVFELLRRSAEHELSPDQLAELAVGLSYRQVSAVMLALPLYPCARTAERMWMLLTRTLPDPYRTEPAVLLGFSLYARSGSTALARRALGIAMTTEPAHRLARSISRALESPTPQPLVRGVLSDGIAAAIRLGIDLTAQASFPEVEP